jgi:hypothetical protein
MVASTPFGEDYFLDKSREAATLYEAKSFIRMGTLQFPDSFRIEVLSIIYDYFSFQTE